MKLAPILVLCLAIAVHQTRAEPSVFDVISGGARTAGSMAQGVIGAAGSIAKGVSQRVNNAAQGAIGAATGISQGVIGAGTGVISNLANAAGSLNKAIADRIKDIRGKIPQAVLERVQSVLKNIQDATRGALQTTQVAAEKVQQAVQELTGKQQENINEWANQAKNKLANSSEDAQLKGEDLINSFAEQRSQDLEACTDQIGKELQKLQKKASSTAERYHEPMNKLVEQVGKCAQSKPNDMKALIGCNAEIREALKPLAGAPYQLGAIKAQIDKSGLTNLKKSLCVASVLGKFRHEANRAEKEIDQLVADDKKNAEEAQPEEDVADETNPAEEDAELDDEWQGVPVEEEQTAPAEEEAEPEDEWQGVPVEEEQTAPAEEEAEPEDEWQGAPVEEEQTAPAEEEETAPADEEDEADE